MSSDRRGSVGNATGPTDAAASADGGVDEGVADDAQADDPWFAPGPKKAVSPGDLDEYADVALTPGAEASAVGLSTGDLSTGDLSTGDAGHAHDSTGIASTAADANAGQAEWFLRTGRAGLHPDSETAWDDAAAEQPADHHEFRVTAAGAPPWAGESTAVSASTPPPWETGPWPGPAAQRSQGWRPSGDEQATHATAATGLVSGGTAVSAALDGAGTAAGPVRWSARTVATAGLVPLVVPGLVVGLLSLRQAGNEAVRKAAWLAVGASIAWAVIIIVIVTSLSGAPAASCAGYPAPVHQAYEKVLTDLRSNAPASAEASDLQTAGSLANSSAATTGQIGVRDALFTMANDLTQARADLVAGRPISALLRQHLTADGAVPSGSCSS